MLLYLAAIEGKEAEISSRLELGDDVDWQEPIQGRTPLMAACHHGHQRVVAQLLAANADIQLCDSANMSAKQIACIHGHVHIIRLLLGHDPSVDWPLLHAALQTGKCAVVGAVLAKRPAKAQLSTFVHQSISVGSKPVFVKMLLRARASADEAALGLAAQEGNEGLCRLLLKYNANPCRVEDAVSPLALAAAAGHEKVVSLLKRARGLKGEPPAFSLFAVPPDVFLKGRGVGL